MSISSARLRARLREREVPQLDFRVLFPVGDATGDHLSDGEQLAHRDFWNTGVQSELERRVDACLHREVVRRLVTPPEAVSWSCAPRGTRATRRIR